MSTGGTRIRQGGSNSVIESQPSKLSRFCGRERSRSPQAKSRVREGPRKVSGSNSVVESQPSKLLVAGSIPVSRSSKFGSAGARFRFFDVVLGGVVAQDDNRRLLFLADVAQLVEHSLGKGEVIGSIPIISSSFQP
jgi:hypothetical protein